jgi:hypothetical protein
MGTTANYAFPYPELTDPPDGPDQIGDLAIAVDSQLKTVETSISTKAYTAKVANQSGITQVITTSVVDLAGATLSVTTPISNTQVVIEGIFDVETSGNTDIFIGTCNISGGVGTQSGEAHYIGPGRVTTLQKWVVSLVTATTYTIKLQVTKVNNSDTVIVNANSHSKIIVSGNGIT